MKSQARATQPQSTLLPQDFIQVTPTLFWLLNITLSSTRIAAEIHKKNLEMLAKLSSRKKKYLELVNIFSELVR